MSEPPIFALCERCGSEGRIYVCDGRDHDGSPRERDVGECPDCEGEGLVCMPGIPRTEWDDLEMFDYFDGAFEALFAQTTCLPADRQENATDG